MAIEIRRLCLELEEPLASFFALLNKAPEGFFHPHPFTRECAADLATYPGKDLYYVLLDKMTVLVYGMLRGWDEGYDTPSLGIVVHPAIRREKLGELMMMFLHAAARRRGATKVRLKVYKENHAARELYKKIGYTFEERDGEEQLVGTLDL